jgi:alpha-glucosidase
VADVITNYAAYGIPLETMWTDIGIAVFDVPGHFLLTTLFSDYMYKRRIFTVDPDYFPLSRVRDIVHHLHSNNQKFGTSDFSQYLPERLRFPSAVLMVDPAVAYLPDGGYGPYDRGAQLDVWLKSANGTQSLGLVWPGTVSMLIFRHFTQ